MLLNSSVHLVSLVQKDFHWSQIVVFELLDSQIGELINSLGESLSVLIVLVDGVFVVNKDSESEHGFVLVIVLLVVSGNPLSEVFPILLVFRTHRE